VEIQSVHVLPRQALLELDVAERQWPAAVRWLSAPALRAIAAHAGRRTIRRSAETGCGVTTLLLSHLSQNHTVFALDVGQSVSGVRNSPLLRPGVTTFVEGPSQQTLPGFRFDAKLQLTLIDGPHAYPFPDLEYYYLYPQLEPGALLVLDDIHIQSIHNLFKFLSSDPMFHLDATVRTTALFTRTDAPTFDPRGDCWEKQGYNRRTLWRYDWRSRLGQAIPRSLRHSVTKLKATGAYAHSETLVNINAPNSGGRVGAFGKICGTATMPDHGHLWVLVHRKDVPGWWPQGGGPVEVSSNNWTIDANYGEPSDGGHPFEIAAAAVSSVVHERWLQWVHSVKETGMCPPVQLPSGHALLSVSYRTVTRH
jgi:hypothetical protein